MIFDHLSATSSYARMVWLVLVDQKSATVFPSALPGIPAFRIEYCIGNRRYIDCLNDRNQFAGSLLLNNEDELRKDCDTTYVPLPFVTTK